MRTQLTSQMFIAFQLFLELMLLYLCLMDPYYNKMVIFFHKKAGTVEIVYLGLKSIIKHDCKALKIIVITVINHILSLELESDENLQITMHNSS